MLTDFAPKHAIDILLLQETTAEDVYNIAGYTTHLNIGDIGQRTAILAEEGKNNSLVVGSWTATAYASFGFVNLYVPCGTSQRQAHEHFFSVCLPCTLGSLPPNMTMGGDFNFCVPPG